MPCSTALPLCLSAMLLTASALPSLAQEVNNQSIAGAQTTQNDPQFRLMQGDEIQNQAGEGIGTFEGVVLQGDDVYLIVSVGDFLGLGGRHVLISPSDITPHVERRGYRVPYTAEQLEQLQPYEMAGEN